jgi:dihydrofolate reductase
MRKLKLQMQITIDGFVAGTNGEMDWMVFDWDDEMKNYVDEITKPVDCIILGRKLAQGFIPSWTSRIANLETADAFAHKMVDTPKIVFSRTLENADWENTKLAKGDSVQEITQLKNNPVKTSLSMEVAVLCRF